MNQRRGERGRIRIEAEIGGGAVFGHGLTQTGNNDSTLWIEITSYDVFGIDYFFYKCLTLYGIQAVISRKLPLGRISV